MSKEDNLNASQKTPRLLKARENVSGHLKREKMRVTKSKMVLVLYLIGRKDV